MYNNTYKLDHKKQRTYKYQSKGEKQRRWTQANVQNNIRCTAA